MYASHSRRRRRSHWHLRLLSFLLVAAIIAAVAIVSVRFVKAGRLKPTAKALLSATAPVKGSLPSIPWPSHGQAALAIEHLGPIGHVGTSTPQPIASVAKIMTAYIVLKDHPLGHGQAGPSITITAKEAADNRARLAQGQSVIPVSAGETLTERQALEAMLIPSANNIAKALARFDSKTASAFVAKMNSTAKALGMDHTDYVDPSGLSPSTVSTASDQLILASKAMAIPTFAHIVDMSSVTLPLVGKVDNYNSLLGHHGFVGIKTGSTLQAGGCLVFAVNRNVDGAKVTLLGAVFGQDNGPLIAAALRSAQTLASAAAKAPLATTVLPAGTPVLRITGPNGRHVDAVASRALRAVTLPGAHLKLSFHPNRYPTFPKSTTVVGSASFSGPSIAVPHAGTTAVRTTAALKPPSWKWRLRWAAGLVSAKK